MKSLSESEIGQVNQTAIKKLISGVCEDDAKGVIAYAAAHDQRIWQALIRILGEPFFDSQHEQIAQMIASLPRRHGGLGLQCAARASVGAYWAGWADALEMLNQRRPQESAQITSLLNGSVLGRTGGLAAAEECGRVLDGEGFVRPAWNALLAGSRPDRRQGLGDEAEFGEWAHGWQFFACSKRNLHFKQHAILPQLSPSGKAMLRSGSGSQAGVWLQALPTCSETPMRPSLFKASASPAQNPPACRARHMQHCHWARVQEQSRRLWGPLGCLPRYRAACSKS